MLQLLGRPDSCTASDVESGLQRPGLTEAGRWETEPCDSELRHDAGLELELGPSGEETVVKFVEEGSSETGLIVGLMSLSNGWTDFPPVLGIGNGSKLRLAFSERFDPPAVIACRKARSLSPFSLLQKKIQRSLLHRFKQTFSKASFQGLVGEEVEWHEVKNLLDCLTCE